MKKALMALFFSVLLLLSACSNVHNRVFQVTETYRITSANGTNSFLQVDLPMAYGYQKVSDINVENADAYSIEDKDGYRILLAEIHGDNTEKTVKISYDVTLLSGEQRWKDTERKEAYALADGYTDSDNSVIVDAVELLIDEDSDYKTALNIFNFIAGSIAFDYEPKINEQKKTASETLKTKKGVCKDYATLMTAMLRAAGISAREISGLVLNSLSDAEDWSHSAASGSHAWVEFYADGQWHFADPTWGDEYFDRTDGYHLSYGTENVNLDSAEYLQFIDGIEEEGYTITGAMTAPIKFAAWSEDVNASIVPSVSVKEIQNP